MQELQDQAFIEQLRRDMLRFAELQLRNRAEAEDAVQEALASAFANQSQFASRAALKTWVFSILKNKVIDIFRQHKRAPTITLDEPEDDIDVFFDERGHWNDETRPAAWGNPEAALESQQFWKAFEACLYKLPENTARAYLMREVVGLEADEICKELGIKPNNYWVLLHRARLYLRACLGENWFAQSAS
jgi:RNA polymerase sigma-70 factor, ECF subfamily